MHRLAVHWSSPLQVNETSKRSEYQGEVMALASWLGELPHGGQILMEDRTFDGIKVHLAELHEKIPHRPDWPALQVACRCCPVVLAGDLQCLHD